MSSVHDTITEALRAHKINLRRIDHPRLGGVLLNITACAGCDWTTEAINAGGEDGHLEHRAEEVASALSAAGFVVRKQVEPEAAKNDASALVAAWNAGFIEGRRP